MPSLSRVPPDQNLDDRQILSRRLAVPLILTQHTLLSRPQKGFTVIHLYKLIPDIILKKKSQLIPFPNRSVPIP